MIYLDNAATTAQKPKAVQEAICQAISRTDLGNPARGSHEAALTAFREVYLVREKAARFFGVSDPRHIAFTANATEGLNRVLKGLLRPGDHVVTTVTEHNSVLRPLYQLAREGISIDWLRTDEAGRLRQDPLLSLLRSGTRALIVSAASNVTGNVPDLCALAQAAREVGALFIVDASQGAGIFSYDLARDGIDVLCTTGHKSLYGPTGTGLVAVARELPFSPVFSGGSGIHSFDHEHPKAFPEVMESGTANTLGIIGLGAGMDYLAQRGLETVQEELRTLRLRFLEGLQSVPNLIVYGTPEAKEHAPVVGVNLKGVPASEVAARLDEDYGICVRPGAHCAPLMHEALGTKEQGIVRFSFSTFTKETDIDDAVMALKDIQRLLKGAQ
ncbi:Cysteine desulfurase [Clostridiaceae bacterium JG1575]|nr:Cysteine desulfurase [Clostridiaceae bacterium JG1575]